jgi:hypothetical protein
MTNKDAQKFKAALGRIQPLLKQFINNKIELKDSM